MYIIIGDKVESIYLILRIDAIDVGSILLTAKIVVLKRENTEPILAVKRTKWRKFIDDLGQIIEANPSRVGKKHIDFPILGIYQALNL